MQNQTKKQKQLNLNLHLGKLGGRRPNSGRYRIHSKGVSHKTREPISHRTPVHINFKVQTYIQNKPCLSILKYSMSKASSHGLQIIYFALQTNHIHLIAEADDNTTLTKGMRSLTISFAKKVKKLKQEDQPIQIERYHLHVLKCPIETRNAILYVLNNEAHHSGLHLKKEFAGKVSEPKSYLLLNSSAPETF